jgi:hypothetical protein
MKAILMMSLLICAGASAQDHFSGINTSQRVGMQNISMNPAELANLRSKYEVQLLALSVNASNNKVGFGDIGEDNFEELLFAGSEAADLRFDAEFNGPAFAFRLEKWGFGIATKAHAKLSLIDIDVNIGEAIENDNVLFGSTTIANNYNQRINGATWGELGFSAARNLYDTEKHKISAGVTLKILFPGSYANFGADEFTGTIDNSVGTSYLNATQANLNIAYSGNLAENFTDFSDYSSSLFGSPNGFGADLGVNYQYKDKVDPKKYIINAGLSIRNIGSMTFKDDNNASTNYVLNIPPPTPGNPGLDLQQFDDVEGLDDIEQILLDSGYLTKTDEEKDFKVKLPTTFTAYADVKIVPRLYMTVYAKQKLNKDEGNDQIASQNLISLTPRFTINNFELWSTWSSNEVSGVAGGIGLRAYGFFIGSGSAITALISDAKQGDIYLGYSFGFKQ